MDYIDYLGIVALLKAVLLVKAVLWPDELRGTVHAHHRQHLTHYSKKFRLIDDTLYKKISFTKTIKKRGPDGMLNLMGNLFFQSII
jgi:hypothetical protein